MKRSRSVKQDPQKLVWRPGSTQDWNTGGPAVTLPSADLQLENWTPSVDFLSQFKLQVEKFVAFHNNTIYIVSDFSAFGIWDWNVTIYITENLQAPRCKHFKRGCRFQSHLHRFIFLHIYPTRSRFSVRLTFENGADVFPDWNAAAVVELAER